MTKKWLDNITIKLSDIYNYTLKISTPTGYVVYNLDLFEHIMQHFKKAFYYEDENAVETLLKMLFEVYGKQSTLSSNKPYASALFERNLDKYLGYPISKLYNYDINVYFNALSITNEVALHVVQMLSNEFEKILKFVINEKQVFNLSRTTESENEMRIYDTPDTSNTNGEEAFLTNLSKAGQTITETNPVDIDHNKKVWENLVDYKSMFQKEFMKIFYAGVVYE